MSDEATDEARRPPVATDYVAMAAPDEATWTAAVSARAGRKSMSGYMWFTHFARKEAQSYAKLKVSAQMTMFGEAWKSMPDDAKEVRSFYCAMPVFFLLHHHRAIHTLNCSGLLFLF